MGKLNTLRTFSLLMSLFNIGISIYGILKGEYLFWLVLLFSFTSFIYAYKVIKIIKGIEVNEVRETIATIYIKTVYFVICSTYFVLYLIIFTKYGINL